MILKIRKRERPSRVFTESHQLPSAPWRRSSWIRCIFPVPSRCLLLKKIFYLYSFSILKEKKKLLVVIAHARRCIALVDDAKKKI